LLREVSKIELKLRPFQKATEKLSVLHTFISVKAKLCKRRSELAIIVPSLVSWWDCLDSAPMLNNRATGDAEKIVDAAMYAVLLTFAYAWHESALHEHTVDGVVSVHMDGIARMRFNYGSNVTLFRTGVSIWKPGKRTHPKVGHQP
jgi:hypothetical protein